MGNIAASVLRISIVSLRRVLWKGEDATSLFHRGLVAWARVPKRA